MYFNLVIPCLYRTNVLILSLIITEVRNNGKRRTQIRTHK
nr:MAG TPA: hypothetical protein [Caudoviricetes sp.]